MGSRIGAALLVVVGGIGLVAAIGQAQSQPSTAPAGQMSGMAMSPGKTMDMDACKCNCMGTGMGMNMGQAKPMEMDHGMSMDHAKSKPPVPAGPLKIAFGDKSAEWTPATLAALPHKTLTVYNEHARACQTYNGVAVIDLLTRLGVPDKPHGKDLRLYLVAEGSDGYKAVYSVAEVNPDVHDATVIVADAMDGKGLADDGPLKLVASGEKRPARWVRNLVSVRVLTAE